MRPKFEWILMVAVMAIASACSSPLNVGDGAADAGRMDAIADVSCATGQAVCGGRCVDNQSDSDHCGSCDNPCSRTHVCVAGRCQIGCPMGQDVCNSQCVNLQTDRAHCGSCGAVCGAGLVCALGRCAVECGPNLADCGGRDGGAGATPLCTNTQTDRLHCGGCGTACEAGQICVRGACVANCPRGQQSCGGHCVDVLSDRANCGGCGIACGTGQVCANGLCAADCIAGQTACGGACRDLANDPANCGACGNACPRPANATAFCSTRCAFQCLAGFGDCDGDAANGCETLLISATHCGACGLECRFSHGNAACTDGACRLTGCDAGFSDCDGEEANGCETNTQSDRTSCGACDQSCAAGQLCSAGVCRATCAAGLATCGDRCTHPQTDPSNCGACNTVCPTRANAAPVCSAGACSFVCNVGFRDCDGDLGNGCEVDTRASVANCGGCGRACVLANATSACVTSRCSLAACNAGFADCNANPADGCEVDTRTSTAHCGACGADCASRVCVGSVCLAPTCTDRVRNGVETDVDCGGSCPACARCQSCGADRDCADGACGAQRRCTVRRNVSVSWLLNCRGPGGGNVAVMTTGLSAGTYEVTPLGGGGTVWGPGTSDRWIWQINCDNLTAPTLTTGGTAYATPEAAFASVSSRTERVTFAGGTLSCALNDTGCSDNLGGVSFRLELVCN
jgi:hypothetical protein